MSDAGNGVREKLEEYFNDIFPRPLTTMSDVDRFLVWLAIEGYVVLPMSESENDTH